MLRIQNAILFRLLQSVWPTGLAALFLCGAACLQVVGQGLVSDTGAIQLRGASFASIHAKASAGESLRIVSLGGSITQNGRGHTGLIPEWFRKRYPGTEVIGVNAGLSSTCSHTGAFRMDSVISDNTPIDLLVVEYAVNDDQDAGHNYAEAVRGMEGIVRRAQKEGIAIIMVLYVNEHLLETVQEGKQGTSLRAHRAVADHYGIPSVDVVIALAAAIDSGTMNWKQYGGVHPGGDGYAFVTGMVTDALKSLLKSPSAADSNPPIPSLDPHNYSRARWSAPSDADFQGDWLHGHPTRESLPLGGIRKDYLEYPLARSDAPGARLRFQFEGNAVGAFVLSGPDAGSILVSIDGRSPREIDLFHRYSKGLNYPRMIVFAEGLEPGCHTLDLEISETHHSESVGHAVNILYLGVNGKQ